MQGRAHTKLLVVVFWRYLGIGLGKWLKKTIAKYIVFHFLNEYKTTGSKYDNINSRKIQSETNMDFCFVSFSFEFLTNI